MLPTIRPWHKEAELEGPGSSSLRPPNASNKVRNRTTDSEVSSVVNDLGDAKQLAQTRSRHSSHLNSATRTSQLVSHIGTNFSETPSGVENIDSDLSQTEALEEKARDNAVKVNTPQELGRTIRKALQTSSWEKEVRKFLPIDKLERLINMKAIEGELLLHGENTGLAEKIWGPPEGSKISELTTRRKIFAILVMVGQVPAIIDFIDSGIYDSSLPFLFRDGTGDRAGSYDVYEKLKGRDGEPDGETEFAIGFFQNWKDHDLESFRDNQWQFLAPYFSLVSRNNNKVMHYNLDNQSILPFIKDNKAIEPPAQHGGSADVRRVKIHCAHQNSCVVSRDLCIFTPVGMIVEPNSLP